MFIPVRFLFRVLALLCAFCLTGCLQYNLDIQFDSQIHGRWIQQLQWQGGQLTGAAAMEPLLQPLVARAQQVGGHLTASADGGLQITVPFNSAQELEERFNRFWGGAEGNGDAAAGILMPWSDDARIRGNLSVQQRNWLLAGRLQVLLSLDLTDIPDIPEATLPVLQAARRFQGQAHIATPWGMRSLSPGTTAGDTWPLEPGTVNQIEADFWLPNPIGIGGCAIAFLVLLGYFAKYGFPSKTARPTR